MPKISVIMPVYNTEEEYLKEAIESVLNQTLLDLELIIVDDGSTNNAKEVIFNYKDERIKYSYQSNKGLGGARNTGLNIAKGEYIIFLDSDDWIDKNTCKEVYQKAEETNLDVLFFGMNSFSNKTGKKRIVDDFLMLPDEMSEVVFNLQNPKIMANLFSINTTACAKLFKKDFLLNNNLTFIEGLIFEDTEFFFRFMIRADRLGFVKEPYYFYRQNVEGSLITKRDKKHLDLIKIFELIEQTLIQNSLFEKLKISFYDFKLKTLYIRYKNIDKLLKKEFKQLIKNDLNKIKFDKNEFKNLSKNSQFIYKLFVSGQYRYEINLFISKILNIFHKKQGIKKKLFRVSYSWIGGSNNFEINNVKITTDKVKKCDLFIALNGTKDKINIKAKQAWVFTCEPPVLSSSGIFREQFKYYDRAYTAYPSEGNDNIINTTTLPGWWIDKTYDELLEMSIPRKDDSVVWVTSNLDGLEGHKKRLKFIDFVQKNTDYQVYGRGINPVESKYEVYEHAKYVLGVENTVSDDYWTEKLADSYLAYSMPIYYGCPNVTKYFPKESMIIIDIEKPEEAKQIIQNAIDEDLYNKNFKYILEARDIVLNQLWVYPFVVKEIKKMDFDKLPYKRVKIPACCGHARNYTIKQKIKNLFFQIFKID